jgi:holliday junction DNA helicase RuvA
MFAFIRGLLVSSSPINVIVEAGGIGYKIFIPSNVFSKLPQTGNELLVHLSFVIREMSHTLYGFLTIQERDFFEALMGVTGIGPKLALNLIGHMNLQDFQYAVNNTDIRLLCKVPGIGKKTAERLLIEMRDKITTLLPSDPSDFGVQAISDPRSQTISDAMSALISLGYNQLTAQKAIKKTLQDNPESTDLAVMIRQALQHV